MTRHFEVISMGHELFIGITRILLNLLYTRNPTKPPENPTIKQTIPELGGGSKTNPSPLFSSTLIAFLNPLKSPNQGLGRKS